MLLALSAKAEPTSAAAPKPLAQRDFVLVLDPGHGGSNDGCRSSDGFVYEKEITLRVAKELQQRLGVLLPHAEVLLTREEDQTLTLAGRAKLANEEGGDLFLSLHANASPGRDQQGFETFLLEQQADSEEAAWTARRENAGGSVVRRGGETVSLMLRELELNHNRNDAAYFAHAIQREQAKRFPARPDRGVREAPFDVLMGTQMPAGLT